MKESEALRLVMSIQAAYPGKTFYDEMGTVFYRGLDDVDYALADRALADWIRAESWPPTVADIRRLVADQAHELPDAAMAWANVVDNMNRRAMHVPSSWLNPAVAQAARAAGGVYSLAMLPGDQARKAFERAYAAERMRRVQGPLAAADGPELLRLEPGNGRGTNWPLMERLRDEQGGPDGQA